MEKTLIERILTARVYDVAKNTPLDFARNLSTRFDNQIYLKREDLQQVFSFKLRGAFNCMYNLSDNEKARGVVAASAGNHAQGVALAGTKLGIKTTIVMPKTTPEIKVRSVKAFGGNAVLKGSSYDDAYAHALELVESKGLTFVHPFDNLDVIAGQGTIGMELLRQHPDHIDAIFLCVGGGGLISGVASYIKYLSPGTKIIGVEHEEAPSMYESFKEGERILLDSVGTFADGAAVRQVGENTFRIAKDVVDEMLLVTTDETCAAIKDVFEETRTMLEPAGALAVAGMKKYIQKHDLKAQELIAIASGANINFDRLRHVTERSELGEQREALLAVTIPEKPGSFRQFCQAIGNRPITEFNYRYSDTKDANVFAGVKLVDGIEEKERLLDKLKQSNYPVLDLSDNELAKVHLRFMVGGHASGAKNEVLYRFVFPERPGALLHFLVSLGEDWNISLFHYRNHGSDFGRVLVGIQIPENDRPAFCVFLDKLGYEWAEETSNPAYQQFLA
ncbi:MAG: Threonine dehydratase biosynthetic (EC [uncultured Thiotrichaceae bacterium]|uniref:L-threonine dehydratase n=1 Tax=uncultured Thiotrichaceae bacterium TaxID=298394 RepID=A0A6S6U7W4_9GAMM|nr:MAG: Threonine dehydratase biosynthetic (EC [uncultured Thiotrichaceae bacterium]